MEIINEIESLIEIRNLILEKHNKLNEMKNDFDFKIEIFKQNKIECQEQLKNDLKELRNLKLTLKSGKII
jgi:hypothetical protein